ncbi:MAG TPA: invasion associated locus B family protein [Stellaceae bacterium]|nr:invasion associated locus B family protein [Stellaceae bacterium]
MVNALLRALLIGGALAIPFTDARAQTPATAAPSGAKSEHLGDAQGWSAFAETDKSAKACYLVGRPVKSEPENLKRGDVYVYVTHRPADKTFNVVSFAAGYPYKEGSDAELAVDTHKFALFTSKDSAWSRDAATDKAVVEAMAKGKQAVLKGTSARGTNTADTYSLEGFAAMLAQIDKACGVKR